eukprot:2608417-Pyramimonas_sp.AAC.1
MTALSPFHETHAQAVERRSPCQSAAEDLESAGSSRCRSLQWSSLSKLAPSPRVNYAPCAGEVLFRVALEGKFCRAVARFRRARNVAGLFRPSLKARQVQRGRAIIVGHKGGPLHLLDKSWGATFGP